MQTDVDVQPESVEPTTENEMPQRGAAQYGVLAAKGFAMGSADVVPGVSGGTMAFILGIYEELIFSIRMVAQPEFWRAVLHFRIREAARLLHLPFLIAVFAGIFAAILTLAPGIEWTLENQPVMLWSFFFGLVVASVFVVSHRIGKWTAKVTLALILGAVFAFWIVGLVPVNTPTTWWFLILSGALASVAMILPGISGSFILVLLGKYAFVINAVNQRDIVSIALIGLGAVIGLVSLAQVLGWLFKRYHDLDGRCAHRLHVGQSAQDLAVERGAHMDHGSPRRRSAAGHQERLAAADGQRRVQHRDRHCTGAGVGRLFPGDPDRSYGQQESRSRRRFGCGSMKSIAGLAVQPAVQWNADRANWAGLRGLM